LLNVKSTNSTAGAICLAKFEGIQNTGSSNYVYTYVANNSTSSNKTAMVFGGSTSFWAIGNDLNATLANNFYIYDFTTTSTRLLIDASGNTGINTIAPTSTLHVNGSTAFPLTTQAAATYTVTASDHTILCNAGTMTINLPAAAGAPGRVYVIKKISAAAGTITIDPNGAETIDGATINTSIATQYQSLMIQSNGTAWYILSNN
jgi:hypothetical protein